MCPDEATEAIKPAVRTNRTYILAEALVMIALAAALYMFKLFTFPEGGSITLGSMVPIFVLSLRRGPKVGIVAGACLGIIVLLIEPFVYNPVQFILDYPLPFALLGVSGFFKKWPIAGVGVGISLRFVCHFLSGALYFCGYMPTYYKSCPVYSVVYNASYLIPEFAISALMIFILSRRHILTVSA
jgi:thiamine transporter